MDKKLYIITNCGDVVSIFENEEERSKEYADLIEEEKKYRCTHYYYGQEEMTRGEYVCNRLCQYVGIELNNAKLIAESNGTDWQENFKRYMRNDCKKCPLKDYSPYKEEKNESV